MEEGIYSNKGLLWSRAALDKEITNELHASACAPDMVRFIQRELLRRVLDGFSILLSVEGCCAIVQRDAKPPPYRSGPSGPAPSAPDTELVGATQQGD